VLIALGEGRFEPREVRTGARGLDHIEIVEGLKAGENVVVAANFLIDAESSLKAALSGFSAPSGGHSGSHSGDHSSAHSDGHSGGHKH